MYLLLTACAHARATMHALHMCAADRSYSFVQSDAAHDIEYGFDLGGLQTNRSEQARYDRVKQRVRISTKVRCNCNKSKATGKPS